MSWKRIEMKKVSFPYLEKIKYFKVGALIRNILNGEFGIILKKDKKYNIFYVFINNRIEKKSKNYIYRNFRFLK